MSATVLYMSMSLDGFIAGPNEGPGNGLGDGGHRLHEWAMTGGDVDLEAGGGSPSVLRSAELYDPTSGRWSTTGSMNGYGGCGRAPPRRTRARRQQRHRRRLLSRHRHVDGDRPDGRAEAEGVGLPQSTGRLGWRSRVL